jgi:hypothetical protein
MECGRALHRCALQYKTIEYNTCSGLTQDPAQASKAVVCAAVCIALGAGQSAPMRTHILGMLHIYPMPICLPRVIGVLD